MLDALFTSGDGLVSRGVVTGVWLAGLLLFGVYLWGVFYSWGNISLDFLDWAEVTGPRYALLQDALTKGAAAAARRQPDRAARGYRPLFCDPRHAFLPRDICAALPGNRAVPVF